MTSESQPVSFCVGVYPKEIEEADLRFKEIAQIRGMMNNCDIAVVYKNGVKRYYENVAKEAKAAEKEIISIAI